MLIVWYPQGELELEKIVHSFAAKKFLNSYLLKEGMFEKFMGFMQSPEGLAERAKVAVVEKTIGTVTPDKSTVMFKIFCTDEPALHKFIEGTEVSKPIMDAL